MIQSQFANPHVSATANHTTVNAHLCIAWALYVIMVRFRFRISSFYHTFDVAEQKCVERKSRRVKAIANDCLRDWLPGSRRIAKAYDHTLRSRSAQWSAYKERKNNCRMYVRRDRVLSVKRYAKQKKRKKEKEDNDDTRTKVELKNIKRLPKSNNRIYDLATVGA